MKMLPHPPIAQRVERRWRDTDLAGHVSCDLSGTDSPQRITRLLLGQLTGVCARPAWRPEGRTSTDAAGDVRVRLACHDTLNGSQRYSELSRDDDHRAPVCGTSVDRQRRGVTQGRVGRTRALPHDRRRVVHHAGALRDHLCLSVAEATHRTLLSRGEGEGVLAVSVPRPLKTDVVVDATPQQRAMGVEASPDIDAAPDVGASTRGVPDLVNAALHKDNIAHRLTQCTQFFDDEEAA